MSEQSIEAGKGPEHVDTLKQGREKTPKQRKATSLFVQKGRTKSSAPYQDVDKPKKMLLFGGGGRGISS